MYKVSPATYAWSINNGTITSDSTAYNIAWTAGNSGTVSLCVTVTLASGCSTIICTNIPINPVNEWYGPFNSWDNAVTVYGLPTNGADASSAMSQIVTNIGVGAHSPVVYIPPGDYYYTNPPPDTVWANGNRLVGTGITPLQVRLHLVGSGFTVAALSVEGSYWSIERLMMDGSSITGDSTLFDNLGSFSFSSGTQLLEMAFTNSEFGVIVGTDPINGVAEMSITRNQFEKCQVAYYGGNQNTLDIWFRGCDFGWNTNCIQNGGPGSSYNAYNNTFRNNGTVMTVGSVQPFFGIRDNISSNDGIFFNGGSSATAGITLQRNTIYDPRTLPTIICSNDGQIVLIDNAVYASSGTVVAVASDALAISNKYLFSGSESFGGTRALALVATVTSRGNVSIPQVNWATNYNWAVTDISLNDLITIK